MVDVTQPGVLRGRIPANKGNRYSAEVLTPDEVRALMAQCSNTSSIGIRYRALFTVLYLTGPRAAEAPALQPNDADLRVGAFAVSPLAWTTMARPGEEVDEFGDGGRCIVEGLRVAPWARVFADLQSSGVRGEEAAEHLREVVDGRYKHIARDRP